MEIIIIALAIVSAILLAILVDRGNGKRHKPHLPRAPAPKHVLEETPKKDISEPVISFVKFLKENPENFLLKWEETLAVRYMEWDYRFKLVDKANKKVYKYTVVREGSRYSGSLRFHVDSVGFLTEEERTYLLDAHLWGLKYIEEKEEAKRKARDLAEREEYKKIYCKEK